ncbi:hypothetical protein HanPSC8_Chr01g0010441 [Helianthus annuus]|nr:hypothetical protein HanPSC8_Chr01g0010441 [Helianthus annuus]
MNLKMTMLQFDVHCAAPTSYLDIDFCPNIISRYFISIFNLTEMLDTFVTFGLLIQELIVWISRH